MNKLYLSIVLSICTLSIWGSMTRKPYAHREYSNLVKAMHHNDLIKADKLLKKYKKITWGQKPLRHVKSKEMVCLVLQYDKNILCYAETLDALKELSIELWEAIAEEEIVRKAFIELKEYSKRFGPNAEKAQKTMREILNTMMAASASQEVISLIITSIMQYEATPEFVAYVNRKAKR